MRFFRRKKNKGRNLELVTETRTVRMSAGLPSAEVSRAYRPRDEAELAKRKAEFLQRKIEQAERLLVKAEAGRIYI